MSMLDQGIEKAEQTYNEKGYILTDDILEIASNIGLSIIDVDKLSKYLIDNGIDILDNKPSDFNAEENKKEKKTNSAKKSFPTITEMLDWGIVSPGDIIIAKGTENKAILNSSGDVYVITEKKSMQQWLMEIYGWESVATYRHAVLEKIGKTLKDMYMEYMNNSDSYTRIDTKNKNIEEKSINDETLLLYLKTSNANAVAKLLGSNFVVLKGSMIASELQSSASKSIFKLRAFKCKRQSFSTYFYSIKCIKIS